MYALLAVWALIIFSITPYQKPLFIAMLLAYSMPAPFIISAICICDRSWRIYLHHTLCADAALHCAIHWHYQTDFDTFCTEIANAGVYKWTSDMQDDM